MFGSFHVDLAKTWNPDNAGITKLPSIAIGTCIFPAAQCDHVKPVIDFAVQ
jgi:hypothetical protein